MQIVCKCGTRLSNTASPNSVEHYLMSNAATEKFQEDASEQIRESGKVDGWFNLWIDSGAIECWRCGTCGRLHIFELGIENDPIVYSKEH